MATEVLARKTWIGISKIGWWAFAGTLVINMLGALLHFAFELSGYATPMALIASVNESTWEHLKFYFWSGLLWSLIQYTYVRKDANNYWFAQAIGLIVTPIVISIAFYAYLGVALPKYGQGFLAADIFTGVLGVIAGQLVASKLMQGPTLQQSTLRWAPAFLLIMIVMFSTFTYYPPKFFLFEDFQGHAFQGNYGILDSYTPMILKE